MSGRQPVWRRPALAVCLAVVFATACSVSPHPPPSPSPLRTSAAPTPSRTTGSAPRAGQPYPACEGAGKAAVGVFRETSPSELDAFERWLTCRVDYAVDYSARDTWADIEDPTYLLEAWDGQRRRLVLGVAMLPRQPGPNIEAGARGDYDAHYQRLARRLVRGGHGDAILRVGWEFNLSNSRWFTRDYNAFSTYWRRIVQIMRAEAGNEFQFDWNVNNGAGRVDATHYYPGDDVVDFVGVDVYDVAGTVYPYPTTCDRACRSAVQNRAWDTVIFGGSRGLSFWSAFASQHKKPLSLPEWGLWRSRNGIGGAENPTYLARMHNFIVDPRNQVAYQAYFEHDGDDVQHRLMTTFPDSGELFRTLFTTSQQATPRATQS